MKFLIKLLLFILTAILAGLLAARPAIAESPTIESSVINPPYGPIQTQPMSSIRNLGSNDKRLPKTVDSGVVRRNPPDRTYSKEEVQQLIKDYSAQYGISADLPLRVAQCESGFRWDAKNRSSTASGIFQYLNSTWAGTDEAKAGLSVFDADANVRAAIKYIASRGHAQPWLASKSCWL